MMQATARPDRHPHKAPQFLESSIVKGVINELLNDIGDH